MKSWLITHLWQIAAIVLACIYVAVVFSFLPLASLSITEHLPINQTYPESGMTINMSISNTANSDYFLVGDLAIFSFNITNTYNQATTFDYNSSVKYAQYGYPQAFTLNSSQSKIITEELPLNSEGSNGFLFHIMEAYDSSVDDLSINQTLRAVSISDELALISQKSTFTLTIIVGIPAIIYGVKEFRELGKRKVE